MCGGEVCSAFGGGGGWAYNFLVYMRVGTLRGTFWSPS